MLARTEEFLNLVRKHARRLSAAARQYVAEADALDLVQETLIRAWQNFGTADERTYSGAWLFVILRNVAHEWQRTAKRRVRCLPQREGELTELAAADLSEPFFEFPAMGESRFLEFLDDRIVAALESLQPAYREVVILSVAGGLNYREIGAVLDCPVGTVMSRMARARRALRERLADYAAARRAIRKGRT